MNHSNHPSDNFRHYINNAKRIVLKVGSALITKKDTGVNTKLINYLAEVCDDLLQQNREVVIVSSGAIAEGMAIMQLTTRPTELIELQALAAVGQMSLVHEYEMQFEKYGRHSAQILLTADDINDRMRFKNAKQTINHLLTKQIIPIINENDVVANDEIRFGDNDRLSALTCKIIEADLQIILTDQAGLFTANPRKVKNAKLIPEISANDKSIFSIATTEGGELGSGGMYTKVLAAAQVAENGVHTVIADGKEKNIVNRILNQEVLGTLLYSNNKNIK